MTLPLSEAMVNQVKEDFITNATQKIGDNYLLILVRSNLLLNLIDRSELQREDLKFRIMVQRELTDLLEDIEIGLYKDRS